MCGKAIPSRHLLYLKYWTPPLASHLEYHTHGAQAALHSLLCSVEESVEPHANLTVFQTLQLYCGFWYQIKQIPLFQNVLGWACSLSIQMNSRSAVIRSSEHIKYLVSECSSFSSYWSNSSSPPPPAFPLGISKALPSLWKLDADKLHLIDKIRNM